MQKRTLGRRAETIGPEAEPHTFQLELQDAFRGRLRQPEDQIRLQRPQL
ncbi:hypothetical protein ACP26L_20430 [Paenibacillus sp. S-38]